MADGGAIAEASASLLCVLKEEVTVKNAEVRLAPPHKLTGNSAATLGVYLYEVAESAHTSTVERQDVEPTTLRGGSLSLDLFYLLTAYPGGDDIDEDLPDRHKILGEAVRAMRDNAVISGTDLRGSLEGELRIARTEADAQIMDIWGTFPDTPYFPSVAYRVGPVSISSQREMPAERVQTLHHRGDDGDGE